MGFNVRTALYGRPAKTHLDRSACCYAANTTSIIVKCHPEIWIQLILIVDKVMFSPVCMSVRRISGLIKVFSAADGSLPQTVLKTFVDMHVANDLEFASIAPKDLIPFPDIGTEVLKPNSVVAAALKRLTHELLIVLNPAGKLDEF